MTLNETAQTLRLACALGLAAVGLSTAKAALRYAAKGTEFDLTGKLVGDQVGTRLAMGPEGGYLVFQDTARLEKLYKTWGFNTLLKDLREARQGALFEK